jgi:sporulation protein YlmC with PRC-barrel domain
MKPFHISRYRSDGFKTACPAGKSYHFSIALICGDRLLTREEVFMMSLKRIAGISIAIVFFVLAMPGLSWAQERSANTFFAAGIIDRPVYDKQGKKIGEVDDLVVSRLGRVRKVTVDVGELVNMGEKIIALPFDEIGFQKDGKIDTDLTKEKADGMPEYNYTKKGLECVYYGGCPYYPFNYPGSVYFYGPYYHRPPGGQLNPSSVWSYFPPRFLASTVIKRTLINDRGEIIGEIDDLVIGRDGKVEKLVISSEQYLGEDKYVTVPFEPLGFTPLAVVYRITPEKLRSLPKFPYKN